MQSEKNELLQFLGGLAMLVGGLYLFSQRVTVSSTFFSDGYFCFRGSRFNSGLSVIPLIIGFVLLFAMKDSILPKIIITMGALVIILSIVAGTSFHLPTITLYEWILYLFLIFGGAGLLARILLKDPERSSKKSKKDK